MKATGTCPKCKGGAFWYIADVAANRDTGSFQQQPTFHVAVTGGGPQGFAGKLEAYACQGCGCVELYLKEALGADGTHVRDYPRAHRG